MSNALTNSVSGLLAFQRAIDVTSNNVANAATTGYSVEKVTLSAQTGQTTSSGYVGSGVAVTGVTRAYSEILATQLRTAQSAYSSLNTYATVAGQVDDLIGSTDGTALTDTLQSFSSALQTLSEDPTATASGTALLTSAQSLVQQLQNYTSQIESYGTDAESQISSSVDAINTLATGIANLNGQIALQTSATGQEPDNLLDQRDTLLNQLSQYVSVSTSTSADGQMNVFIGSGQALVVGGTSQKLTTIPSEYNATQNGIGLVSGGITVDITSQVNGGSLGGLLNVRSQVIEPALNSLGQIAVGLADAINSLQESGLTQSGSLGTDMFSVGDVGVTASTGNTGGATISATRTDVSDLTADDLVLSNVGGTWQLTDNTTGSTVTMTGTGTAADPFEADGLSIVVNGGANSGDSFLIQPTAKAVAGLSVLLTSASQIASASAVQTSAASSNTGTGTIAGATVTDPTNPNLLDLVSISFTDATDYTVTDTATGTTLAAGTYTAGQPITGNGWNVSISGTPAAGDTFTVASNVGNTGDNSNLLSMIAALSARTLNGGTTSLSGAANSLVNKVALLTQQAQTSASAQQTVQTSASDALSSLSGVNLDQEAANLVAYQQAYEACAQMVQASNTMFNSLITAIQSG